MERVCAVPSVGYADLAIPIFPRHEQNSDDAFKQKLYLVRNDAKARMAVVWNHCKAKTVCEPDEPKVPPPPFISHLNCEC